jgi:hypothetical protein
MTGVKGAARQMHGGPTETEQNQEQHESGEPKADACLET